MVDTENSRIVMYSPEGHVKVTISHKGAMAHELNHPMCVALTRDGEENICVSDSVNASIKVFGQDGTFITAFSPVATFDFPYGLAITSQHYFVVTDVCRHSVIILYPSGSVRNTFGQYGDSLQDFDHPHFVAVNSHDHVIVSDSGNTCIKTFNLDGTMLQIFIQSDFRLYEEHYILLNGLTVDPDDNIIIIGNCTIYIAARNGRFWEVLIPEDGLHSPKCVSYSPLGQLVVSQCDLDQLHEICTFWYKKEHYWSLRSLPYLTMEDSETKMCQSTTSTRSSVSFMNISSSEHESDITGDPLNLQYAKNDYWCNVNMHSREDSIQRDLNGTNENVENCESYMTMIPESDESQTLATDGKQAVVTDESTKVFTEAEITPNSLTQTDTHYISKTRSQKGIKRSKRHKVRETLHCDTITSSGPGNKDNYVKSKEQKIHRGETALCEMVKTKRNLRSQPGINGC